MENRPVSVAPARLWPWLLGTLLIAIAGIGGLGNLLSGGSAKAANTAAPGAVARHGSGHVAAVARAEQETETPTEAPTDETPTPEDTEEPTETLEPTETIEPTMTPPETATMMAPTATSETPATPKPGGGGHDDKDRIGYIKGVAFIDLDQDGKLDPNDPGLNDVGVHLVGGGLDLLIITGPTGQFSFDGLGAGRYDVFIAPGPEWRVTTPSRYNGVRVQHNVVQGIDFGLTRVGAAPSGKAATDKHGMPKLPKTGVGELPSSALLALVAVVLGVVAVTGLALERRH